MSKLLVLLLFLGAVCSEQENWSKYVGDVVVRTVPQTEEHLRTLRELERLGSFDFWTFPRGVGYPVDIQLGSAELEEVSSILRANNVPYKTKVHDLARAIQNERLLIDETKVKHVSKDFDLNNYHPYEVIVAFLQELSANNPLVSVSNLTTTYEGRDVWMASISTRSDDNKPVIFLDCTVHAREWIAGASCLWFINQLSTQYGVDPEVTAVLDAFDWLIIPISNPDGYAYTWTTDRLWRKNRVPTASPLGCRGVDFNRNFDSNFGGAGSSNQACIDTYHGASAFSEFETQAMRDVLAAHRPRVKAAVSIHSYSQLWMAPFGYKYEIPADNSEMLRVMTKGVEALQSTYGTVYQFGNHAETLYVASGTTLDYAYEKEGVIYAYLIELRDTGDYGFELPPTQIAPTATETFNGLKAMALAILEAPTF